MDQISITPLGLEIKTIVLGNKKLTKSIFNQIEYKDCFDSHLNFIGTEYFGYVNDIEDRVLLWNDNGKLKKTELDKYINLRTIDNLDIPNNLDWILKKCVIKFDLHDNFRGKYKIQLGLKEIKYYNNLVDRARSFINKVLDHQIYI